MEEFVGESKLKWCKHDEDFIFLHNEKFLIFFRPLSDENENLRRLCFTSFDVKANMTSQLDPTVKWMGRWEIFQANKISLKQWWCAKFNKLIMYVNENHFNSLHFCLASLIVSDLDNFKFDFNYVLIKMIILFLTVAI